MLFRISKIQFFESNSQRGLNSGANNSVVQNIKDTIFESNSQQSRTKLLYKVSCSEYQRYNFWKQFTTYWRVFFHDPELFRISKIQFFESNSQPDGWWMLDWWRCSEYQRYNFLKQFTTTYKEIEIDERLFRISKIQFFESNSQLYNFTRLQHPGCSEYQRYNFLKAIHNSVYCWFRCERVVQNIKDTIFWKQFTTISSILT